MAATHERAAAQIFALRNAGLRGLPFATVDLHGLHPAEALRMLAASLEQARGARQPLYVITGTGMWTKMGTA